MPAFEAIGGSVAIFGLGVWLFKIAYTKMVDSVYNEYKLLIEGNLDEDSDSDENSSNIDGNQIV